MTLADRKLTTLKVKFGNLSPDFYQQDGNHKEPEQATHCP
jgi:hypothetical protein